MESLTAEFIRLREEDPSLTPERYAEGVSPRMQRKLLTRCRIYVQVADALRPPEPGPELDSGSRIARFQVEAKLGVGATATVYAARGRDGEELALKVLHPHLVESPVLRERFLREGQVAARLEHPNLLPVFDSGQDERGCWLAMKRIEGCNLEAWLQGNTESSARSQMANTLVEQIGAALSHAHAHEILHRDLKPQNILVDAHGKLWLSDLGLARALDEQRLTLSGLLVGTPAYMSPEQILAQRVRLDARSDLFSLAMIVCECLYGTHPFMGRDLEETLARISFQDPRLPDSGSKQAGRLERVLRQALAKNPADRYPSVKAFAQDWRRAIAANRVWARSRIHQSLRQGLRFEWVTKAPRMAMVMLLLGGAGLFLLYELTLRDPTSQAATFALQARVEPALSSTRWFARSSDGATDVLGVWRSLGQGAQLEFELEPGNHRLLAEASDGRFTEFDLELSPDHAIPGLHLVLVEDETWQQDMTLIPAAELNATFRDEPQDGERAHLRTLPQHVSAFWIDRFEVTNGAWLEFMEHTGAAAPSFWPERDEEEWRNRPADFDRLPVVGITMQAAQQYAAWRGKRLPTLAEWELAARGPELRRFPWGESSEGIRGRCRFLWSPPESHLTAWERYLALVTSVDDYDVEALGPYGLIHAFGNAWEMTTTHRTRLVGTEAIPVTAQYRTKGAGSGSGYSGERPDVYGYLLEGWIDRFIPDPYTGFRCVRSQDPELP